MDLILIIFIFVVYEKVKKENSIGDEIMIKSDVFNIKNYKETKVSELKPKLGRNDLIEKYCLSPVESAISDRTCENGGIETWILPKNNLNDLQKLKQRLTELESYVLEQYRTRKDDEIINGIWLDEIITAFYSGGRKIQQLDYLENYLDYYKTEVLPFRKIRGQRITDSTIKKQITIINKIKDFIKSQNIKVYNTKLIDLWYDEEFMDKWYDSSLETKIALSETEE